MSSTTTTTTTIAMAIAATATIFLAACGKAEQTVPVPNAPLSVPKSGDDLSRVRELMEQEEARRVAREANTKRLKDELMRGSR